MAFDDTHMQEDAALLMAYARGDHTAARELASAHAPRLMALAWRMLNDQGEAEDVTQEALLRLWKIAPEWRNGEARISTWLYRVASNLCTDRLRKRRRVTPLEPEMDIADDKPGVVAGMIDVDRKYALTAALEALPENQRLAVVLRHLEELSNPEIAQIMDLSVKAVESLTARGKRGLKTRLSANAASLSYRDE